MRKLRQIQTSRHAEPRRGPCLRAGPLHDDHGAIAIYVALMLPFLVGLALLVVDGGRIFNLDTSLQNNVDALALAGAAELDRRPTAHVRACRAMQNLVSNKQLFVDSNAALDVACDANGNPTAASDVGWCWLRSIPADRCKIDLTDSCQKNSTSPGAECAYDISTSPETTHFIHVRSRTQAASFSTLMPTAFVGGSAPASLRRTAVAGMARAVCVPTPLMICNPWEASGIDTIAELRTKIGYVTTAREYGGGAAPIGPGQFGLLDPAEVFDSCGNTAGIVDELTWQLAGAGQGSCEIRNGLCPKTGVVARLDNAVNTRFDIYKGMNSYLTQNPAALVPAARTIWNTYDRSAVGCRTTTRKELNGLANGVWYPRGDPSPHEDRWDRVSYFSQYLSAFPSLNSATAMVTLWDGRQKQLGTLTRYEAYRWEAAQAAISTSATTPFTYTKPAASTCFKDQASNGATILNQLGINGRIARRDLYGAVANCLEIKAAIEAGAAYSLNGSSTSLPLPSLGIARFFITEPVNRTYEEDNFTIEKLNDPAPGSNAPDPFPIAVCPLASGKAWSRFAVDVTSRLEAGRTFFLEVNTINPPRVLGGTLPDDAAPTLAALAAAFTSSATEDSVGTEYVFCAAPPDARLFIATTEATQKNQLTMGLSVTGASKRIFLELVDVFAADNGGSVTRDVVRLHR